MNERNPDNRNHAAREWPAWFYRLTQNNNPVSQETSGNLSPEERQCCICEENIQSIQASLPVWSRISDIIKELCLQQLQAFITEINNYDPEILDSIQFHATPSDETINAFIITPLQSGCYLSGQKCVLCLLNYVFQRIGRSDLGNQVYRLG